MIEENTVVILDIFLLKNIDFIILMNCLNNL